jgi:hypothetical protein
LREAKNHKIKTETSGYLQIFLAGALSQRMVGVMEYWDSGKQDGFSTPPYSFT